MSLWSSFKNTVKKVGKAIKGAARQLGRLIAEVVHRILPGIVDLLFGFLNWPPKKLRIKVLILSDELGARVANPADLTPAIDFATRVFKDRLNVKLLPHHEEPFTEVILEPAPTSALEVGCGTGAWKDEFGDAGDFFARHLAGLVYPVTVFVVRNVEGEKGCSLGPLTDYVTLDVDGVKVASTLAHEVAHACGLWHSRTKSNLMWHDNDRGDGIKWWQRNLFRSSRHVMYW